MKIARKELQGWATMGTSDLVYYLPYLVIKALPGVPASLVKVETTPQ